MDEKLTTIATEVKRLSAIATGIEDLPFNLAKTLADVMASSSMATGSPTGNFNARTILLPQLDRRDFKKVVHWTPELYYALRKNKAKKDEEESEVDEPLSGTSSRSSKGNSTLSCYMEDENGNPIPEYQRDAARYKARIFWNGLLKKGRAPASGQKIDLQIREEFVLMMEESFPWLRYCENHWKCDRLWTNHYSQWYNLPLKGKKVKGEPGELGAKKGTGEVFDVDIIDINPLDTQEHPKRHRVDDETNEPKRRRVEDRGSEPKCRSDKLTSPHPRPVPTKRPKVCYFSFLRYTLS